ncbi:MAG: aldo/keto reductase, partial [Oscillospiraceae bacterium]
MTLLDTAEMYGEGRSEALIGRAISGLDRERLTLVSKVYPHNAGRDRIFGCCEQSLRRLGVDRLELYLLHWRGSVPLAETVECMEELRARGRIAAWGVSNFDVEDLQALWDAGGTACAVNQLLYHLGSRGIEVELLPWMERHGVALMAYCPLAQGGRLRRGLLEHPTVTKLAASLGATPAQLLLAFALRGARTIAIPKASSPAHTGENAAASLLGLDDDAWAALDAAFPAPRRRLPLDIQ